MEITFKVFNFMLLSGPWWMSDQVALASPFTLCEWNFPQKRSGDKNTPEHSQQANCSGLNLSSVPSGLPSRTRTLDLSYNNITEIRRFDFSHHSCQITQLILSHNSLEKIDDRALSSLHGLQNLNLSSNTLGVVTEGLFQGLRNLRVLDLQHNQLQWIHKMAFTDLANLEVLWLQNNNLRTIPDAVNILTGLTTLSLGSNRISQLQTGDISCCPDLKILQLDNNQISTLAAEAFQNHDNLRIVDLSSNQLEELPDTTVKFLWERGVNLFLHGNPLRCDCRSEQMGGRPAWMTDAVLCQGIPSFRWTESLWRERAPLRVHTTTTLAGVPGKSLTMPCRDIYNGRMVKYWKTPVGWLTSRNSCNDYSEMKCLCNGSLTIQNFSCQYGGLYYCFQEDNHERVIIPYRVVAQDTCQKSMPKPRLPREVKVDTQDTVSDSHFTAAVTLSVLVTFLGGFAVGVFSRSHLIRCLQKAKSSFPVKGGRTSRDNTNQISMEISPSGSINRENGISSDGDALSAAPSPPAKAPRNSCSKWEQAEETAHPECGDSLESNSSAVSAIRDQEPPEANLPPHDQVPPRPARRSRVIKLYNYDEEGNHYSHIKALEEDANGAPRPKQRTRSLNRLSAIMSSVETPDQTSPNPESELDQSSEEGSLSGRQNIQFEI